MDINELKYKMINLSVDVAKAPVKEGVDIIITKAYEHYCVSIDNRINGKSLNISTDMSEAYLNDLLMILTD